MKSSADNSYDDSKNFKLGEGEGVVDSGDAYTISSAAPAKIIPVRKDGVHSDYDYEHYYRTPAENDDYYNWVNNGEAYAGPVGSQD